MTQERVIYGPDRDFLTMDQTCERLGIPERTLKVWIDAGKIPAPKTLRRNVVRYSWRVVVAISELIACGFLDPEEAEEGEDDEG